MWYMPTGINDLEDLDDYGSELEEDVCPESYMTKNNIRIADIKDTVPNEGLSKQDAENMHEEHRKFFR